MYRLRPKRPQPTLDLTHSVYQQYDAELQRFLMRRSDGGSQTARDLAQEVYLRLLRVEEPELLRNPQGYMYRVASHVVYEYLLKKEKEPVTYSSPRLEELDARPPQLPRDELQERLSAHRQLEAILELLPPVHRTIFVLHKRDGWSYKEVAEQLDLSVHTVKKYLYQALAQLRTLRLQRSPDEKGICP